MRRAAVLRYALMHYGRRALVRPLDTPFVRTGEGDAIRVLMVGNGLVHGWGVASHQLAPSGEIARGVRTITGTDCEVDYVGDATMSAETALEWVADRADRTFHAAVIAIGSNDALRLVPIAAWTTHLTELVAAVRNGLPDGAPVVLAGVPDVFVPGRIRRLGPVSRRHARRLDRAAARVAELHPDVRFVAAPRLADLSGQQDVTELYARFAVPIAVAVADAVLRSDISVATARDEHFDRSETAAIVAAARWNELPELQEIVERAKAEFGVSESAVTLLDGDRNWHVAHNGSAPAAVPRSLTYCEAVVANDEPLVVPDATRHPLFADNPFLGLTQARFYAGVPIHAADGTTLGAFCLLNGAAKSAASVDLGRLQEFADEAEALIHRTTADFLADRVDLPAR